MEKIKKKFFPKKTKGQKVLSLLRQVFVGCKSFFSKEKKTDCFLLLLNDIKRIVFRVNDKILLLTDKICKLYDKYISGKPKKVVGFVKGLVKKALELIKKTWLFIVAFYKKDKKRAIIYFILLYVIYKTFFGICGRVARVFQHHKNEMVVSVRQVKAEKITKDVSCYGYLESENNLQYVSEVRGNVDKILVQEKQYVKQGQLLMVLDSEFTKNSYASAKSIYESKKLQFEAVKKLYQDGLESKGNLKAMESDLENASSNFESAKKSFNGLTIVAPFNGYIDNIKNKEGAQVNPGTPLFTLERTDAMQVKCDVQNLLTDEVAIGDKVRVFVSGNEIASGRISVIGDSIDVYTGSRTILVKNVAGIVGFEEIIKPGMSVMLKVSAKSNRNAYKISSEALETTDTGAFMVKVLNPENGEITKKNIWLYDERDGVDYVYGLQEGDLVVERGHEFVEIGEKGIEYNKIVEEEKISAKDRIKHWKDAIVKFCGDTKRFISDMPELWKFIKIAIAEDITELKEKAVKLFKF